MDGVGVGHDHVATIDPRPESPERSARSQESDSTDTWIRPPRWATRALPRGGRSPQPSGVTAFSSGNRPVHQRRRPNGHNGLGRSSVSGARRVPAPAAKTTPATLSAMASEPTAGGIRRCLRPSRSRCSCCTSTQCSASSEAPSGIRRWPRSRSAKARGGFRDRQREKMGLLPRCLRRGLGRVDRAARRLFTGLVQFAELVPFLFAVALVAVLVHPMSRDYQRIWFR